MTTIVVGTDGSDNATKALRFAMREAQLRHARLHLVHGWLNPAASTDLTGLAAGACEQAGAQILQSAAALVAAEAPGVDVSTSLVSTTASAAILDAAKDADLVVVGSRGHGGFVGLLIGSVSSQVAHHAPCPVIIVPG
jgi:nucleotide-binding universal stress UspA family protein